jgi:hypothetical protein
LRALAVVCLGELAAPGSAELQAVPSTLLLVPQPTDHWLQRLRQASPGPAIYWC